ncbi:MAG: ATP-binding protein [Phycisphaerae bacterium]
MSSRNSDKGFQLLRYFAIASIAAIAAILVLVGTGLSAVLEADVIQQAQINAVHVSAALRDLEGQTLIESTPDGKQELAITKAEQIAGLDRRLKRFLDPFDIIKIKIYNRSHKIIYSTDADIIGAVDADNAELARALAGQRVSKLEAKEHVWDLANEQRYNIELVETYIPVLSDQGEILGSFEIYKDVSKHLDTANRTLVRSIGVLLITLCAVFGVLGALMRRAARIIHQRTMALRDSEAQLRRAFNEVESQKFALDEHAIVSITDTAGNITYTNDSFCEISGYMREELLGQNHRIIKSSHHSPEFYRNLWRTITRGDVWKGEIKNRRKDGTFYWVSATIVPFSDETGKIVQYVAIRTDISERKEAEEIVRDNSKLLEQTVRERTAELARAKERAEANAQVKTEFLTNMSHELRTPLHGILSFADFGLKKAATADRKKLCEYFQMISLSGHSLLVLLNNVLDLAKLESGTSGFVLKEEDLVPIIRSVASEFSLLAAERKQSIRCLVPEEPVLIPLDHDKIAQVIRNLLSNAVKYAQTGGPIEVALQRNGASVQCSVCDHGAGIPPGELDIIFDKFVQSSDFRTGAGGTGLGLAICRKIVSGHRGRIWAENNPGGGARFVFEIPLK